MEGLTLLIFLSTITTKSVDVLRNALDIRNQFPKVLWNIASFGLGFLYAFLFNFNVFPALGVHPRAGVALTGFVLGGGGSLMHEVMDALSARGHLGNPKVPGGPPTP